jgi:hypothetical protein
MWRRSRLGAVVGLVAALAASCADGGQTGQPTAGSCSEPTEVPPDYLYDHGTTPQSLAHAFEGTYRAPLVWLEHQPVISGLGAVEDYEDSITITIAHDGQPASRGCDGLQLSVTATIETLQSGISESGPATLRVISAKQPLLAWFSYGGSTFSIAAELTGPAASDAPRGRLQPRQIIVGEGGGCAGATTLEPDPTLDFPGTSAVFPSSDAVPEAW